MSKVVLLDMDGVLVTHKTMTCGRMFQEERIRVHLTDPDCVARLNYITEQSGAKIVISSAWKIFGLSFMQRFLARQGVKAEVIDTTLVYARADSRRGDEIGGWLRDHPEITHFVIIDDDTDMGVLIHKLVRTNGMIGLQDDDVVKAVEQLA